jgi:hypothetical protein
MSSIELRVYVRFWQSHLESLQAIRRRQPHLDVREDIQRASQKFEQLKKQLLDLILLEEEQL